MSSANKQIKHIAIAGNIGAGKTTLSSLLAQHYGWTPMYEDANTNPYLSDFYNDMQRWAFNLQIYFLNSRYQQVLNIRGGDEVVVQDRTIYEDAFIFAPNLHEMGLMSERDFENYFDLFKTMSLNTQAPDLLIYLRSSISTLVDHIQTRGRDYEGSMSLDYLKRLNEKYENWIANYTDGKLLVVEIDGVDFQNNPSDLGMIISRIDTELFGLFGNTE